MDAKFKDWRDRRAVIGVFTAAALPVILGIAALVVDAGAWSVSQTRLQFAADAAAVSAGYLLSNTAVQAQTPANALATYQAVALAEVNDATASGRIGTLVTPVGITFGPSWSSVTVTLTSRADLYFANAIGFSSPTLTATATVGTKPVPTCVLALSPNMGQAIMVDGTGSITAPDCQIFSNSSASDSIYLDSGTINGSVVGTHGGVLKSSSGGNSLTPATPNTYAAVVADPFAGEIATIPGGACDYNNATYTSFASPGTRTLDPGKYCGNTTIGGNGMNSRFNPGVYYIVNGDLIFDNPTITLAAGVTFVITGTAPGKLSYTNNSNTSVPFTSSSAIPKMVFWQTCAASNASIVNLFTGGSTLVVQGAIYTPCGELSITGNSHINAAANASLSVVARRIYAGRSGSVQASGGSSSAGSPAIALRQ